MTTALKTFSCLAAGLWLVGMTASIHAEVTEELHETYPLAADGRVSLDNVNGSIHISTWDREEVRLDAVKKGRSQEDLDEVTIEIKTNAIHLRVHTEFPDSRHRGIFKWGNSASVEYELTVPATARLKDIATVNGGIEIEGAQADVKASTVNGSVKVNRLKGRAELSTVNGRVEAGVTSLEGVNLVSATTVNGSVELNLPHDANADVSAETVNGGISGDVPVKKNWPVGASVNAKLGEGGAKVTANTVNGGIEIHVARAGE